MGFNSGFKGLTNSDTCCGFKQSVHKSARFSH